MQGPCGGGGEDGGGCLSSFEGRQMPCSFATQGGAKDAGLQDPLLAWSVVTQL